MNDLIKKWKEFMEWWKVNGTKRIVNDKELGEIEILVRPDFNDFMNWLVENEKEKLG
jgi:hypothetical protein